MAKVSSGSFTTNASENRSLKFNWSVDSTSISGNYKKIYWSLVGSGSASGYVMAGDFKVVIDGETVYNSSTRIELWSGTVVASGYKTLYHDTSGNKKFSASVQASIYEYAVDNTGSGTWELPTIQRYATSVQSLSSKTETSITMNWSSDNTVDYIWYSTNNGSTWTGKNVTDGKSGSYTISGLSPYTSYNIKTRVRRKDSQLTTDSSALSVRTYKYPYCNSAPNFTIGNAVTLGFFNPLGRNITWQILGADGSIIAQNTTTGTSYKGINGDGSITNLYKSIPNAKSGTYTVKITYGSSVQTTTGGTYSIKGTEVPTFSGLTYYDGNSSTVAVTGNNQHIVQKLSTLYAKFPLATANYGAGKIAKYILECNGFKTEGTVATGTQGVFSMGTVDSNTNVNLKVTAVDSRGLSSSQTVKVTMLAHTTPNAVVTLERLNNYEDETYLTVDGSVSSVNGKNTVAIKYRYKQSGGSYGSYVNINDRQKYTLSLSKEKVYIFNVVVTDAFGSTFTKEYTLEKGVFPLFIDTGRNSIGVGAFPKREKSLEVKGGQIYLERDEENVDAIYIATRTDTGRSVGFGVGKSGIYRGMYDYFFEKWLLYANDEEVFVNGIKFDEDTFGDSGWKTVTFDGSFTHYNDERTLRYRRVGKQVFISGAMKPTATLSTDTPQKAFTLPEGYRPARICDFLCQGSVKNSWLCEISSNGVVTVSRYGTTEFSNISSTTWLPIYISFLVD